MMIDLITINSLGKAGDHSIYISMSIGGKTYQKARRVSTSDFFKKIEKVLNE